MVKDGKYARKYMDVGEEESVNSKESSVINEKLIKPEVKDETIDLDSIKNYSIRSYNKK